MKHLIDKVKVTCEILLKQSRSFAANIDEIFYVKSGYKTDDIPPKNNWIPYTSDCFLSGNDQHFWFKFNLKTPSVNKNQRLLLSSSTGYEGERNTVNPQGTVYLNGEIIQALDTNHTEVRLEPNKDYEVYIYFYMGSEKDSCHFKLWLSYLYDNVEQLYYDIFVPLNACLEVYEETSAEYANTLTVLEKACNIIDLNYPNTDEYYEKINLAREFLKKEYYDKMCGKNNPAIVNCFGHTHIDVAWLWTLAQTKEKVQRSFSTVIELMKYYPEYVFMMSQPQLFKFLSEIDPKMYSKIQELVKQGKWELEGAMWLEADCNLTSGESLVRQILHGKRFLKKEFDVDSEVLWLPDVFGYSAAMPQILLKSGIKHFITSKISWNDTNMMPYDTFMWQGIDGSEIITDFITVQNYEKGQPIKMGTTYVGRITPKMVAGTWNRYQQKEYCDEQLLAYGWGDGGGGPTIDMLEQQRRLEYGLPLLPKTRQNTLKEHLKHTESKFFDACKKIGRTPKWVGELYLELHRGTYTSIAKNKRYNRFSEFLMQKLETSETLTKLLLDKEYHKEKIHSFWETILLNQFHDIIPGSSIEQVYKDSWKQYETMFAEANELQKHNLSALAKNVNSTSGYLVYNSLGFQRNACVRVNDLYYEVKDLPAFGWSVVDLNEPDNKVVIDNNVLENDFFVLKIDDFGRIVSLFDKRYNREVFKNNELANEIQIFEDTPVFYDNWEISEYYEAKCKTLTQPAKITCIDEGCRKGFEMIHQYHNSSLKQRIFLYDNLERVDVENVFDWNEHNQIVKIAFPVNVHSNKAVYDIQFGNVERNTHKNTSWDEAKFEVCGQKWVDISEYNYGVSLINDCKYGFNVADGILKLTALKSGTWPNENADQGLHEFNYAIFPHKSDFRVGKTVKEAYSFNQPLQVVKVNNDKAGKLPELFSFVSTQNDNIVIETIKLCEDSNEVIVRLYDAFNSKTNVKLDFGLDVKQAFISDLMENSLEEVDIINNSIEFKVNNYEIVTLKLKI